MEICDFCEMGELELIKADEPWHTEYFLCPICDSTYNVEVEIVFEPDF